LRVVLSSKHAARFNSVAAFQGISPDGQGFILEGRSGEHGADRYVYVGAGDCDRLLTGQRTKLGDIDPATALRERLHCLQVKAAEEMPPFVSGAIGYFAYETAQQFEPSVGDLPADPMGLPQAAFFLPERFVVYDRKAETVSAVVLLREGEDEAAAKRVADRLLELASGAGDESAEAMSRHSQELATSLTPMLFDQTARNRYEVLVRRAKVEIERGELIQVVLSQRVVRYTEASPMEIYRAISTLNPSPYMFMLNFGGFAVVGSSPELMLRSRGIELSMHPIAGTRPRGASTQEDAELEAELLTSEKERAEHVMLVDLARNDLGRVSEPGSVNVELFMGAERYSHVMHLVSRVNGRLNAGADGLDAFVAGFPLGTLTGTPRLRAVKLIAELEAEGRGPYCGGVGWFDANGDVDTGTVIRCVVLKGGEAHVQGGGGIVFDSDPEREYLESVQKIAAQLQAIEIAERRSSNPATKAAEAITG
jgi:anthranilate synthase component 1